MPAPAADVEQSDAVRTWLRDAGLTQREAAKRIGLTPPKLCLVLNGRRRAQIGEARLLAELVGRPFEEVADVLSRRRN